MTHDALRMYGVWKAVVSASFLCLLSTNVFGANDVGDRKLVKQPAYKSTPRYALLEFGVKGESRVWMVVDDQCLYVDQNANGDLTDDGPPIEPQGRGGNLFYDLDTIALPDGSRHTKFSVIRWKDGKDDTYALSVKVDGRVPMYAGYFGTFWSASPQTAPAVRFGAPLRPRLMTYNEFTAPASWSNTDARWFRGFPIEPFKPNRDYRRLAVAFVEPGGAEAAESRLSIEAIRSDVVPVIDIDWPVAKGAAPLHTSHRLTERCCYWIYYDMKFAVPAGVVPGTATVTISVQADAMPISLVTDTITVPVVVTEQATHPGK